MNYRRFTILVGAGVIAAALTGVAEPRPVAEIPPCPCDCADPPDGVVDIVDFLALLGQWGTPGSCDADGNGVVDITDFLGMLARWGPCP
ncbi:MAG: GC-type dockerin domain-anchored protein [Planctomycetota bacterium]|jgi:hypothetical protein